MKKTCLIFGIVLAMIPSIVSAGRIVVYPTNIEVEVGNKKTFTITAQNATGKVDITTGNQQIASVSATKFSNNSYWFENDSSTVTVTGKSPGTSTITIKCVTVTDSDTAVDFACSNTVTVTVKPKQTAPTSAPKVTTSQTKPTQKTVTKQAPSVTTRGAEVTTTTAPPTLVNLDFTELKVDGYEVVKDGNAYYVTVNKETTKINIFASAPEGVKITGDLGERGINDGKNVINYVLIDETNNRSVEYQLIVTKPTASDVNTKLSKLKIIDNDINFNPDVYEYTLEVSDDVKELYIIAEGNNKDVTITGTGFISIDNEKTIKITSTYGENNTTIYTINIKRVNKKLVLFIIIGVLSLGLVGVTTYFILKDQGKIKKGVFDSIKEKAQSQREIKKNNTNVGVKIGGSSVVGLGSAPVQPTQVTPPVNNGGITPTGNISEPQQQVVQTQPVNNVQPVQTVNVQPTSQVRTVNVGQPVRVVTKTTIPTQTVSTVNNVINNNQQ